MALPESKSGPVLGARFRTQNWDLFPAFKKDYNKALENGPNFGPEIWHPKWARFSAQLFEKHGLGNARKRLRMSRCLSDEASTAPFAATALPG